VYWKLFNLDVKVQALCLSSCSAGESTGIRETLSKTWRQDRALKLCYSVPATLLAQPSFLVLQKHIFKGISCMSE